MSAGEFNGLITLLLMALFIGIWVWAWRKKHKKNFDRMASLPMEDEQLPPTTQASATTRETKGKHHD